MAFTFDATKFAGYDLVVFESVYAKAVTTEEDEGSEDAEGETEAESDDETEDTEGLVLVGEHKDLTDEAQTVTVAMPPEILGLRDNSKPFVYGALGLIAAALAVLAFFMVKAMKKKKTEETEEDADEEADEKEAEAEAESEVEGGL